MVPRRLLLFACVCVGAVACGPSFQTIYEGDARFEHCYALEENPNVALQQKGECWRDWLAHYTYGQTHDKVMYAATRAQAIRRAPELPTDEALMHAAPGERGQRDWAAGPAPTSAFTPPPKTWGDTPDAGPPSWTNDGDAGASAAHPASPAASASAAPASAERPPLAACTGDCEDKWAACRGGCKGAACEACTRSYKGCIRNCAK
ncbi:hypothetical protein LZC95_35675 [Pendulispora brunnea]|uniref:Uncharacterized protein n=1 Tax=Pendulispora brunnea TaxID=2905690 RepID=A0ABZ2K348_9BACT